MRNILSEGGRFAFPKSIYAVRDAVAAVVGNQPNALLVDFFAGSATTLNAVNLLNATDGGQRQCILVTNNEVSEEENRTLTAQGFQPGQDEWEQHGICRSVTWPRSKFTMLGNRDDGTPLPGDYLTGKQVTREKPRTIRQLGFTEGRNLPIAQRKQIAALLPGVTQSKIDDGPWFLDDDVPVSVLWDIRQAPVASYGSATNSTFSSAAAARLAFMIAPARSAAEMKRIIIENDPLASTMWREGR